MKELIIELLCKEIGRLRDYLSKLNLIMDELLKENGELLLRESKYQEIEAENKDLSQRFQNESMGVGVWRDMKEFPLGKDFRGDILYYLEEDKFNLLWSIMDEDDYAALIEIAPKFYFIIPKQ